MNALLAYLNEHPVLLMLSALFVGALGSYGFAPTGIWILLLLSIAFLFCLTITSPDWKRAFAAGWCWGVGFFSLGLSWLHHSMAFYGNLGNVLAALGVLALAAFLAVVPATVMAIARKIPCSNVVRAAVLMPALWTLGEMVRGVWVLSFGWLSVGYALIDSVFATWAPILGVYGVGFVAVWSVGLVLALMMVEAKQTVGMRATLGLVLGALAISSIAVGLMPFAKTDATGKVHKTLEIRIVQPDLPVVLKGTPKQLDARLERMQAMSERTAMGASTGKNLDIIIWPEGVYQWPLQRLSQYQVNVPLTVAKTIGATVLFNAFNEPEKKTYFNSIWVAKPDEKLVEPVYAKHHLVPFGEYVPAGFRWFTDALSIPMNNQAGGKLPQAPVSLAGVSTALQICYEVTFAEELRVALNANDHGQTPAWIVNTANLIWFGDAVTDQFTQMSRMRAKETARPVVQSLNHRGSAVIAPDGSLERKASKGAQNLDVQLTVVDAEVTPFVLYGHWPVVLWALLLAMGVLLRSATGKNRSFGR